MARVALIQSDDGTRFFIPIHAGFGSIQLGDKDTATIKEIIERNYRLNKINPITDL